MNDTRPMCIDENNGEALSHGAGGDGWGYGTCICAGGAEDRLQGGLLHTLWEGHNMCSVSFVRHRRFMDVCPQ